MSPYSQDLRERVLVAIKAGKLTNAQIAETYAISESTVEKWKRRWKETKKIAALPHAGGPERVLAQYAHFLRAEVKQQPDVTLLELCERLFKEKTVVANTSMMCRELQTLRLSRKKKSFHDSQRDTPRVRKKRREFAKSLPTLFGAKLENLKFLDEFGIHLGLTRLYGRAQPHQRVVEATAGYSGPRYTVVAALDVNGVSAPMMLEGAMNQQIFESYIATELAPTLKIGDIVFMDNLSVHKSPQVQQCIEACGARLEFLPPYSPDFNPIEKAWSKAKTILRSAKAHTAEALLDALCDALRAITSQNATAWFAHCGYAVKP